MLKIKPNITTEWLYEKIDTQAAFEYYFGKFNIGKVYNSVLRKDSNPSTTFYRNKKGEVKYHDFAKGETYDVIGFVAAYYGLNLKKAIQKIAQDFNLIQNDGSLTNIQSIVHKNIPSEKKERIITIHTNPWTESNLFFWSQFAITQAELELNCVTAVGYWELDGQPIPCDDNTFAFSTEINGVTKYKIYSPYNSKYKWTSNVPNHHPFWVDKLEAKGDILIICKAVKDAMLFKKYFKNVIVAQNESLRAVPEPLMMELEQRFGRIYTAFDMDKAGREATEIFNKLYYTSDLSLPVAYYNEYGIKDHADYVKKYGLQNWEYFLKTRRFI